MFYSPWFRHFFSNLVSTEMNCYAVVKGRNPGIYGTWNECKDQIHKFPGAIFKKFSTKSQAEDFISTHKHSSSRHKESQEKLFRSRSPEAVSSQPQEEGSPQSSVEVLKKSKVSKKSSKSKVSKKSPSITGHFLIKPTKEKKSKLEKCSCNNSSSLGFMRDSEGRVDIYTDGACSNNGKNDAQAGIGVYFGDNHPENVSRPVYGRATNNSAEIEAVTEAADIARKHGMEKIKIITDSEFLINCIEKWMPKWKASGWKTAKNLPVVNKEELIRMERALKSLDVEFSHVRGHQGVYGNEMADRLARSGANCPS